MPMLILIHQRQEEGLWGIITSRIDVTKMRFFTDETTMYASSYRAYKNEQTPVLYAAPRRKGCGGREYHKRLPACYI